MATQKGTKVKLGDKIWLNPTELEEKIHISKSTQAKMRSAKKIPYAKLGGFVFYDEQEVSAWIEQHKVVDFDGGLK